MRAGRGTAVVGSLRNDLGESPTWSAEDQALYWVDITGPAIHRYTTASGQVDSWRMPDLVGSLVVRRRGGLLVALRGRLAALDTVSGVLETLVPLENDRPENRPNDGRCDRSGRFWIGTMHKERRGGTAGSLYRFDAQRRLKRILAAVEVPNGLAWNRDGTIMYFADTFRRAIFAYPFDSTSGEVGMGRIFASFEAAAGRPDGSAIDVEDYLWTAIYGGGCLHRYAPDGRLDRVVPLPVTQPTSCTFGGPDLGVLYVTSARRGLLPDALMGEPHAGALLALDIGVKGIVETPFAG